MSALRRRLSSLNLFKQKMAHGLSLVMIKLILQNNISCFSYMLTFDTFLGMDHGVFASRMVRGLE